MKFSPALVVGLAGAVMAVGSAVLIVTGGSGGRGRVAVPVTQKAPPLPVRQKRGVVHVRPSNGTTTALLASGGRSSAGSVP